MPGEIVTESAAGAADEVRLRANALRRDNFCLITEPQKLERATGIEPVSEAWEASVLPLY